MSTSVIPQPASPSSSNRKKEDSDDKKKEASPSDHHIAFQTAEAVLDPSTRSSETSLSQLPPLPSSPSQQSSSSSDSGDSDFVTNSIITASKKESNNSDCSHNHHQGAEQHQKLHSHSPVTNMEYTRSSDGSKPPSNGWSAGPTMSDHHDNRPPPKAWVEPPSRSYSGDRLNTDWGRQTGSYSNGNSSSSGGGTPSDRSPGLPHPSNANLGDDGWPKPKEHLKGWSDSSPSGGGYQSPPSSGPAQGYNSGNAATPPGWGTSSAPAPVSVPSYSSAPAPQQQYQQQPPIQSYTTQTNHQQFDQRGRPLSPDGWPAKKSAVRGFTDPVPDFLTEEELKKMRTTTGTATTHAQTSGWMVPGGGSAVGTGRRTPTQSSINESFGQPKPPSVAGFQYPSQGNAQARDSARDGGNSAGNNGWRTSTPKPAPKLSPTPPASHVSAPAGPSNAHVQPQQQQQPRSVSGWTLGGASTDGNLTSASSVPPVPAIPQQYASSSKDRQPPPLVQASTPLQQTYSTSSFSTGGAARAPNEAWILSDLDAVKSNNWTPTTPSTVGDNNQQYQSSNEHGNASRSTGWTTSGPEESIAPDENSIRPSESASNVGMGSSSSVWEGVRADGGGWDKQPAPAAAKTSSFTPQKPMRQFQGEKDSDTGSTGSSGSYQDNPNALAGGWQRTPPRNAMSPNAQQTTAPTSVHPQSASNWQTGPSQRQSGWNGTPQQGGAGWSQPSFQSQSPYQQQQAPMAAPTPKRWESTSQQFVGDLERAATPRGGSAVTAPPMRHNRSGSTVGPATTGSMSIRGAHKYHAESIQLQGELAKIKAQVQQYEKALSSISDGGADRGGNDSLSRQLDELRSENESLRRRVDAVEAEKAQLKKALLPVLQLLGIKFAGSDERSSGYNATAPSDLHTAAEAHPNMASASNHKPVGWF